MMSTLIPFAAALLPAMVLLFYIWKKDKQKEPTSLLAVPGHYAFAILMGYYYSVYHFIDHSSKVAVCVLLVPVVAHGVYDALAMSGMVNEYVGGICFFVLIYFCVKMHKVARKKVLALLHHDEVDVNSTESIHV